MSVLFIFSGLFLEWSLLLLLLFFFLTRCVFFACLEWVFKFRAFRPLGFVWIFLLGGGEDLMFFVFFVFGV